MKGVITFVVGIGVAGFVVYVLYKSYQNDETLEQAASDVFGNFVGKLRALGAGASGEFSSLADTSGDGTLTTSAAILKATSLIAGLETFSGQVYPDPPGQTHTYSIGYGHQVQPGEPYYPSGTQQTIAEADAFALLQSDVSKYADCVAANVTAPLSDNQRAALISLCYNIGCAAFGKSTLVAMLNNLDYSGAASQFAVWRKAGGNVVQALVDRRAQEAALFQA